jgi:succinate-semialdehyde dehydrogenase/glutarate-semialdehyde dehydrogenase
MYLDGNLADSLDRFDVVSPGTETAFASIAWAGPAEADKALAAADRAYESWSRVPIKERVSYMLALRDKVIENADLLRETVMMEVGKTWGQTEEDVQSLVDSLTFYSNEILRQRPESLPDREGTHRHELRYEPVGVVVAFLAWNFPLLNLGFKLGPALAAGCPIIIKPSPKSPVSAYMVGRLCAEAGFPPGVVNVLCGPDEQVSSRLASSTIPALLTLIGSAATGMKIAAAGASSIKRYSMELGGNAPVIVFKDADLDKAVDVVAALKFGNAGQICVAPNRVLLDRSIKDEFSKRIVARANSIRLGFGKDEAIDMGPVIDGKTVERLGGLVAEAVAGGATLLTGGGRCNRINVGHFFEPTVLDSVRPEMSISETETFGPIVSLLTFDDEDDAICLANGTSSGLVAYVFTRDLDRAERAASKLRFGEVQINGVKYGIDLPHGGIKQSGMGHDCSHLALRDYLAVKRVTTAVSLTSPIEAQS